MLIVLVGEVCLRGGDKSGELALILRLDVLEGHDGGGLLVDNSAETGLALNNDVRDTHLAAECRKEDNELNRVNVVCDDNKRSLLSLNEGDAVVEAILGEQGLLVGLGCLLARSGVFRGSIEAGLLLLLRLRAVLVQKFEKLRRSVLVEGVRELSDSRRNLETLVKDDLLALKANIFGPLDETGEIGLVLDVLANAEVLRTRLEERVLDDLGGLGGTTRRGRDLLSGLLRGLVIETRG